MKKFTFYCACIFLFLFTIAVAYVNITKPYNKMILESFTESQANIAYQNKAAIDQATTHICSNKKLAALQEKLKNVSSEYYEEKENAL
jgi:hypothetical protein